MVSPTLSHSHFHVNVPSSLASIIMEAYSCGSGTHFLTWVWMTSFPAGGGGRSDAAGLAAHWLLITSLVGTGTWPDRWNQLLSTMTISGVCPAADMSLSNAYRLFGVPGSPNEKGMIATSGTCKLEAIRKESGYPRVASASLRREAGVRVGSARKRCCRSPRFEYGFVS
jgi:hypothetical protein